MRTERERTRLGMTVDPVLDVGMSPISIEAPEIQLLLFKEEHTGKGAWRA